MTFEVVANFGANAADVVAFYASEYIQASLTILNIARPTAAVLVRRYGEDDNCTLPSYGFHWLVLSKTGLRHRYEPIIPSVLFTITKEHALLAILTMFPDTVLDKMSDDERKFIIDFVIPEEWRGEDIVDKMIEDRVLFFRIPFLVGEKARQY